MAGPLTQKTKKALKETEASAKRVGELLNVYLDGIQADIPTVIMRDGGQILGDVIKASPVDTGRFRAGWSEGARLLGIPEPRTPTKANPKDQAEAVKETARGRREGLAVAVKEKDRFGFFIQNSTRYGPFLEAGVSLQAPAGVVRPALERHRQRLLQKIKQIKTRGTK